VDHFVKIMLVLIFSLYIRIVTMDLNARLATVLTLSAHYYLMALIVTVVVNANLVSVNGNQTIQANITIPYVPMNIIVGKHGVSI
jgi:hypothetical protein